MLLTTLLYTFRVCIVNNLGTVLLDKHVRPAERVTDFRTQFSGIRPADLKGAESLEDVAAEVAKLVEGRILVGHAITNDLQASSPHHQWAAYRSADRLWLGYHQIPAGRSTSGFGY